MTLPGAGRYLMIRTLVFVVLGLFMVSAQAETIEISRDWNAPDDLRRIRVASATASSVVDPGSGNYAVAKVYDGDRRTKWAAADPPDEKLPQWVELKLPSSPRVSCVAVFGETAGNDGIVNAKIQIGTDGNWFQTVGSINDAQSGGWMVRFPPTNASSVRLFITRSSGPTPHTDVFEVEVYGPKLSAAELKDGSEAQVTEASALLSDLSATNHWWNTNAVAWFGSLATTVQQLQTEYNDLMADFEDWEHLPSSEQQELAETIDSMLERLRQFAHAIPKLSETFDQRFVAMKTARQVFSDATEVVAEQNARNGRRLFNKRVFLQVNPDNSWNAIWNTRNDAALFHVGFDIEADGYHLTATNVETEVTSFKDAFGHGQQISQTWGGELHVERQLRIYDGRSAVVVSGRIMNNTTHTISLGVLRPLTIRESDKGAWLGGDVTVIPSAVYMVGASEFQCVPGIRTQWGNPEERSFSSTQVLNLTDPYALSGVTVGFLSAFNARPDFNARFRSGRGGVAFNAEQPFLGRHLDPGESLQFDGLYVSADDDAYNGLEQYASAASHFSIQGVRTRPTSLWCSWYAHRMDVSEDLVLANAGVAAKYFQPLGFEFMQLDHGWQIGDVTGNWTPDTNTFPHGFSWLAQQLRDRYHLKLGVWIAPTDVAETSDAFRQHPEWMLKDGGGKPLVNWRWYWKPNPNCYELDASNPDAAAWMEETFHRLSSDGVSYYKIDFIASSGGEQFFQSDPKVTRGWSVLRSAMEAVRRGAGTNAWIRYCQPPPLLSAGLADSAYGGEDTLDAGLNGDIRVLRNNARSLAASYWLHDRLYHREVCDMSVRMQADIEEVRMRLAMMALAGCSISFSDELQYLPLSRIRMMQACLPVGGPPMKPLDLFQRTIPSVWHVHCKNQADEWDVIGLFNFENVPETRTVESQKLGLPAEAELMAYEFWEQKAEVCRGRFVMTLPPQTSRIVALRRLKPQPQVVGTDLHLLQGYQELTQLTWNESSGQLSGKVRRAPEIYGNLILHVPTNYTPHFSFPLNDKAARLTHLTGNLWSYEVKFRQSEEAFAIPFDKK